MNNHKCSKDCKCKEQLKEMLKELESTPLEQIIKNIYGE